MGSTMKTNKSKHQKNKNNLPNDKKTIYDLITSSFKLDIDSMYRDRPAYVRCWLTDEVIYINKDTNENIVFDLTKEQLAEFDAQLRTLNNTNSRRELSAQDLEKITALTGHQINPNQPILSKPSNNILNNRITPPNPLTFTFDSIHDVKLPQFAEVKEDISLIKNKEDIERAFLKAAENNDLRTLHKCLIDNVNINVQDEYGNTALMLALANGNLDIADDLLCLKNIELKTKNHIGLNVIMIAKNMGLSSIAEFLTSIMNKTTISEQSFSSREEKQINPIPHLEDEFISAVKRAEIEKTQNLLDNTAINNNIKLLSNALEIAITAEHKVIPEILTKTLELKLLSAASTNKENEQINTNIVQQCLESKHINVNCCDRNGNTPLLLALNKPRRDANNTIINTLINHPRIDLEIRNSEGNNARLIALEKDNESAFESIVYAESKRDGNWTDTSQPNSPTSANSWGENSPRFFNLPPRSPAQTDPKIENDGQMNKSNRSNSF